MTAAGADGRLARYLLGHLSVEEEERIELEYLGGEDAFALVQEAEHDLIDDYVAGRLSADDARRFEARLLPRPEMAGRVAFARALHRERTPVRRPANAPRWLASAAAAVLAVVSTGLGAGLVRQERAATRAHAEAQSRIGELERAVAARQAPVEPSPPPDLTAPRVFELRGGASRGSPHGGNEVEVPRAGWVPLRMLLDGHLYPSYTATLQTAEGRAVEQLPVERIETPAAAEVMVPASSLKKGTYVLVLRGIDGAVSDEVDGFTFRVRPPRSR